MIALADAAPVEPGQSRTPRGIIGLVLVSIALAAAFALLSVYAPALDTSRDGGTHALSNAGTGFAGIVALAEASGMPTRIARDAGAGAGGNAGAVGLLVLTPRPGTDPKQLEALVTARDGAPTLIILPKWRTRPRPDHAGWIEVAGTLRAAEVAAPLARVAGVRIVAAPGGGLLTGDPALPDALLAPLPLQGIEAATLTPVLVDKNRVMVLGLDPDRNLFILADPDLLANHVLGDAQRARNGLAMLAAIGGSGPGGLVFDVTLSGFGTSPDLLRLAFEPPFLAMTLCLLAAAALAGGRAFTGFGTPVPPEPAYAMGKRALADTAADLMRMAAREPAMAVRYATLMLANAAAARGAPPGLDDTALAAWFASHGGSDYATLAATAAAAGNRDAALAAAQALHTWQTGMIHDRR